MTGISTRLLQSIGLVVIAVGAADAFISREWDLLMVFLLSAFVQLIVWLQHRGNRLPATVRPDLAHWLEQRSQESGEPLDDLLDRAVAWYKHGLYPHDADA